ncbi:hypothetical protein OG455_17285 [Kitasatospora sp. NBC_01287]|uniref:imidazolonepropionase-like domain-containing protein n=1 Tax=Kitasatospora sp. NBC_01287 TaxID=2903573 RepID=UPI00225854A7|nr:hypothetical protein [Kitasatospora sp. NBC_01287]MCX4747252.1 hypothetical protein [Kitasatospora sp. NBC_01287]
MLTLHRAALLLPAVPSTSTAPPLTDGAVLVRGDRIAALGGYAELAAAHPDARRREWPAARLTPGLAQPRGALLLEHRYHPDPREELGADPLPLPSGGVPEAHYGGLGGSARRGLQRMLAHGTTALAGPFEHPAVRAAVARSGLRPLAPGAAPEDGLGPADGGFAGVPYGSLVVGERADFAIFEQPGGACLGTVLAGRLLHRRR